MKFRRLVFLGMFVVQSVAFAATSSIHSNQGSVSDKSHALQLTDASKSIVASKRHYTITINVKSNATTGYSWFLEKTNDQFVQAVNHQYIAPSTKLVGAPGVEQWTFLIKTSAMTVPRILPITLRYARPWELSGGRDETFYVVTQPKTKT